MMFMGSTIPARLGKQGQEQKMTNEEMIAWAKKLGPAPMGKSAKSTSDNEWRSFGRDEKGYWVRRDYYVPESYSDDDEANSGSPLRPRMGSTRVTVELYADTYEGALGRIREFG